MSPRTILGVASALLLASCMDTAPRSPFYPQQREQMAALERVQQEFAASTPVPQRFEFPGAGVVTVLDCSLDGYPGNTYVRARLEYQNTTGAPVVRSWLTLDVLDGDGRMVASQATVCIIPIPIPIQHGAYFVDELRTQTFGAHLQPGWSWRVTCRAELVDPTLDDPVPVTPPMPAGGDRKAR